ncbi:MAG: hypothetical protein Fur006_48510 [Coleofasciculaceae cyanobacterium]
MVTQNSTPLSIQEAQQLLKPFNCIENKSVNSESEKALLRQALLLLAEHSDYQILGICADTTAEGLSALKSYAESLSMVDRAASTVQDIEQQLRILSERMLIAVAAKYGKDSYEYEMAGGTRKSARKRFTRKSQVSA